MTAWPKEAHPSSLPPSLPPSSENKTILHTGDFRASDGLRARTTAWLKERGRKIDTVYLDTTYCNAKVCPPSLPPSFPPSLPRFILTHSSPFLPPSLPPSLLPVHLSSPAFRPRLPLPPGAAREKVCPFYLVLRWHLLDRERESGPCRGTRDR